jgi:Ni2+-binding GTPase involved in maturation of urease and hydrogenase
MERRGGTSEVVNLIYFHIERVADVMRKEGESGMRKQRSDVFLRSSLQVVNSKDFVPFFDESLTKVGTQKSSASGNENLFHFAVQVNIIR